MSKVTDALDAAGISYKVDGWAPLKPPQQGAYAVVFEEIEAFGDDRGKTLWFLHSPTVELYDDGFEAGRAVRDELCRQLAALGVKFKRHEPTYISTEKVYMTVFDIEDYYEKESEL